MIEGRTAFDQIWIDRVSEGLIVGCNRARPQPRPPHWDVTPAGANVPLPAPRPGLLTRAREELASRLRKGKTK